MHKTISIGNMLDKLKDSLSKFARLGVVDKKEVEDLTRDIQRILIQSDVEVKLVFDLTKNIKEKSLAEKIPKGLTRREHVINIVYKELVVFLGEEKPKIPLKKQKILLVGLFGSGKTTTTIKLAKFYMKKGLKVGIIGADVYRPAALEQLKQLGEKIKVPVYGDKREKDASKIVKKGLKELKKDVIIIDSAGRNALDKKLGEELKKIDKISKADENILVISGDIGQAAKKQASEFDKIVELTGVIVTKMDSSAKGGGALSSCFASNVKVKFIGVGEKINDLEIYDPVRFTSRLLGMGDLQSLIEKAEKAITPEKAKKIITGDFTLQDFYDQIGTMSKMGSMDKILEMIPGFGSLKVPKGELNIQEEKMQKWKHAIESMTAEEKQNADIIDSSRIKRISNGSGVPESEIRDLIKQYRKISKIMKKFKSGKALKRGPFKNLFKGRLPF